MASQILNGIWKTNFPSLELSSCHAEKYISTNNVATTIAAIPESSPSPPYALFDIDQATPLDLDGTQELRFWFKSTQVGYRNDEHPFYLSFVISNGDPTLSWERLIPVKQSNKWELHRLWLDEDFPAELRSGSIHFRLASLNPELGFTASIGDLLTTTPQTLHDVESCLKDRLHERVQILDKGAPHFVSAIVDLPENPGDRPTPFILIIPWAVQPQRERGGSVDIVDNFTYDGAYTRPVPWDVQLEFSIDVFVDTRRHKTQLLEFIIKDFTSQPYLIVNGEPLSIIPFSPTSEEAAESVSPGRSPLFYQITVAMDRRARQLIKNARPHLLVGRTDQRDQAEIVNL